MAGEVGYKAVIGGKQAALALDFPLGTETVATAIGTSDVMIVFSAAILATRRFTEIRELVAQLGDLARETDYDETRLPDT